MRIDLLNQRQPRHLRYLLGHCIKDILFIFSFVCVWTLLRSWFAFCFDLILFTFHLFNEFFFCFSPYLHLLYFFFVLLFFSFDDTLPLTYGNSTHQCQINFQRFSLSLPMCIIEIEYLLTMILQNLNKNLMRKRQS